MSEHDQLTDERIGRRDNDDRYPTDVHHDYYHSPASRAPLFRFGPVPDRGRFATAG